MNGGAMPPELKASFCGLGAPWTLKKDRGRGINYPIKPSRNLVSTQTPKEDMNKE
jgi:hypothetical protein